MDGSHLHTIKRLLPTRIAPHSMTAVVRLFFVSYRRMSLPTCGYILPNMENQLSPSQRTTLLADSIVFVNASTAKKQIPYWPKFKSGREFLQFKKARILSNSTVRTKISQPSALVEQLNTFTKEQKLCP